MKSVSSAKATDDKEQRRERERCILDAPRKMAANNQTSSGGHHVYYMDGIPERIKNSVSEGNNNKISHIEANQNILRKQLSEHFQAFRHLNSRGREPTVGMQLGLSTNH